LSNGVGLGCCPSRRTGKRIDHPVARLRETTPDDGIEGIPSIDEQKRDGSVEG
jgi:hypothetical protein